MNQIEVYEGNGENEFERIPRLEVNGKLVLTSSQLADFYGCSTSNLRNTFNATEQILLRASIILNLKATR